MVSIAEAPSTVDDLPWDPLVTGCTLPLLVTACWFDEWLGGISTRECVRVHRHGDHDQLELPEPFDAAAEPCLFA